MIGTAILKSVIPTYTLRRASGRAHRPQTTPSTQAPRKELVSCVDFLAPVETKLRPTRVDSTDDDLVKARERVGLQSNFHKTVGR